MSTIGVKEEAAPSVNSKVSSYIARRLRFALYAGLAAYCVLSLTVGPAGLVAYRGLGGRRTAMEGRLAELRAANESLRGDLESLRSDPDRADREARELGYLRPGETFLVIAGRAGAGQGGLPAAGEPLAYVDPPACPDSTLKELSLGLGLAVLIAGLAGDARRLPAQRKSRLQAASRT